MATYGHMAIGPYATNMGKYGIPGKSNKNVAQQCYLDGYSMFLQDFMAKKRFLYILALFLECKKAIFFKSFPRCHFTVYNAEFFITSYNPIAWLVKRYKLNSKKTYCGTP